MAPKPDPDASIAFLRLLYPNGPWTLTAIHPTRINDQTGDAETHTRTYDDVDFIRRFLSDHASWNLYYNVNPTIEPVTKKPWIHQIAAVHYLHIDVDAIPGETPTLTRERVEPKLLHPPPGLRPVTGFNWSGGGGANGLWALAEPLIISGDTVAEREACGLKLGGYSRQIEMILGGADACHNIDRILRLPGTLNWPTPRKIEKYGRTEPVLATMALWDPGRVYPISDFVCLPLETGGARQERRGPTRHGFRAPANLERIHQVSDLGPMVRDEVKECISTGQPPGALAQKWAGDRSRMILWVCCELVRAGTSDAKIYSVITDPIFPVSEHVLKQRSGVKRYAERQIDKAHDMAIHPDLVEFNEVYAAIENAGGKPVVIKENEDGTISYLSPAGFRDFYENRYVKITKTVGDKVVEEEMAAGVWWWKNRGRRQFGDICFEPEKVTPGRYNLWRGFAVEPRPGEWNLYADFVKEFLCSGNQTYFDYTMRVLAYWVQHPAEAGHVAIVMRGEQGTGKGTFASVFGSLWGIHYYHAIDGDNVFGRFTGHLRHTLPVYIDEAMFAGDHKAVAKVKGLVTEPHLNIEDKGLKIVTVPNYLKFMIATNKKWAINAEKSDRRFLMLETKDVPTEYVRGRRNAMMAQLDAGGRAGWLYDLLRMDLSQFDLRSIPQTEALSEQKELSMSTEQQWWHGKLYAGRLHRSQDDWGLPIITTMLTDDYYDFFQKTRAHGRAISEPQLGKFLAEVVPAVEGRALKISEHGKQKHRFPPLRECRVFWSKYMRASFTWPEVDERPDAGGDPQAVF